MLGSLQGDYSQLTVVLRAPQADPRVTRRAWGEDSYQVATCRICAVTTLADAVLPLIRTRADLSRWSASNAHGRQMHEAVDNLEAAIPTTDPAEVYALTHKALMRAVACLSSTPQSLRQHRCRPEVWLIGW